MLGSKSRTDVKHFDIFQCMRCETVIDSSATHNPPRSDE